MSEKRGWINFLELRKSVEFPKVLELYNVKVNVKGHKAQGFCPLPNHKGQKRSPSFSVNLVKGIWQCFGCGAKGNVIDFCARMEGLDPFKGKDVRKAAELLQEKLGVSSDRQPKQPEKRRRHDGRTSQEKLSPTANLPTIVNAPLDFVLKHLDPAHPYLSQRGFTPETIREFGLGFCNRGILKGRIAIPIHNEQAQLVAYAGRLIDDRAIDDANPKYKLPPPREHSGKLYEFHKSALLYNAHRIRRKSSDLIVVEGFPSVWWLWQQEYKDVVALMGWSCSVDQVKLILEKVEFDGRIWCMTDGDEAGERCAAGLFEQLAPYRFVRWVKLKDGEQPTDCNSDALQAMLSA